MKNTAIIIASIFFLLNVNNVWAGEGSGHKKFHAKSVNTQIQLAETISNMLGYPSYILDGTSEAVMISYSVDENNVIHIAEISSPNTALKNYVMKHMDGKKMKKMHMEGRNGVVKVHFNGCENEKLHFQY